MADLLKFKDLDLTPDQETRLKGYLWEEITRAESERRGFIDGLKEEIEAYEAPPQPEKSFPWRGAANMIVALIGTMVDTVFPRLHSTIFSVSNIVTVEEWPPDFAQHAKAWEDALQWSFDNELHLERVANSWFMEAIIHGTSVVKVYWDKIERDTTTYTEDGDIVRSQREVVRDQPVLEHVSLADLFIPFQARSIEEAEWIAQRIRTTYGDLKLRENNGFYRNVDQVLNSTKFRSPDYEAHREDLENTAPMFQDEGEIFECWVDFDLDGDGILVPLLVTIELDTHTLLRVQPHPYRHKKKPFVDIVYFPRHDRFYGIGLARQLLQSQDEITTIRRQRLDSSTIANTRMWKIIAGSRAAQSFQGTVPGGAVFCDALDEIDTLQIGDVPNSTYENERIALQYAQQRAGISDFMMGVDLGKGGNRTTATQTVAAMQEARTRFNWTLDQARDGIRRVAEMVTSLYQQFLPGSDDRFDRVLGQEKAELVHELLRGSPDVLKLMSLQVTASSSSVNKAIERQDMLGLVQTLSGHMTQVEIPLVQLVMNPQAPPQLKQYALDRLEGLRVLLKRVLEAYSVRNVSEVLGEIEALREFTEIAPAPAPIPTGPGGPAAPNGAAGMAGLIGGMGQPFGAGGPQLG